MTEDNELLTHILKCKGIEFAAKNGKAVININTNEEAVAFLLELLDLKDSIYKICLIIAGQSAAENKEFQTLNAIRKEVHKNIDDATDFILLGMAEGEIHTREEAREKAEEILNG